jgi:acetaldehyde dehydrogenase (acetylating)
MAEASPSPRSDLDLVSVQEARTLARLAKTAQSQLVELSQERIDAIVEAMVSAIEPHLENLAALAVEETGFGVVADKIQKNRFATHQVAAFIRPMRTVGVVARHDDRRIIDIAEPFGVVAAIVPSTNPTSTAIYKVLISLKARCAIVLSPHPSAARCITRVAEIMAAAAAAAGAPPHSIGWMTAVTLEGTQELMRQREVAVILATGGMGLVRAAYSAGKPAYGVGPGNAPCYIESSADLGKAAADIIAGKTFDNGLLCSSPNSVVVDAMVVDRVKREFASRGAYFLSADETARVAGALVTPQRLPSPDLVGRSAETVAQKAGVQVPTGTKVLVAELAGVGRDFPLSIEKLCPVLSFYVVADWQEACERCKQILRYGGMGHTMSIHSTNDDIILQFGLHKPAFRIIVNSSTTHGSIGLTTGLDPAMTLGCGGFGGNSTSDNISPRHLLNIKRLAYELRPLSGGSPLEKGPAHPSEIGPRPRATSEVLTTATVREALDRTLSAKGYRPAGTPIAGTVANPEPRVMRMDFVCEDDVRAAVNRQEKLGISSKTIVTPAARDLASLHSVFVEVD